MEQFPITDTYEKSRKYSLFPFSTQANADPMVIEYGQNEYFFDAEGNKYFDLSSQYVNVNLGFNNDDIIQAVDSQMHQLHYTVPFNTTDIRSQLCEKIINEIAPDNMGKVFLTLGGSDSNDIAIRIAKAVTGKSTIFSQYHSYHGATLGSANLSGDHERLYENLSSPGFIHFFGYNSNCISKILSEDTCQCDLLLSLLEEQILTEDPNKIAAIFFETMSMTNLVIPPEKYYKGIREICDKYHILLIFDEVLVGFGRTGKWFACEHYDIQPDIITMGKGINSSYLPLGGVIVSKKIAEKLDQMYFSHGLTASFHPVSCASAIASINYIQTHDIIENAAITGAYFGQQLKEHILKHPYVQDIRGIGMFYSLFLIDKLDCPEVYSVFQKELLSEGFFTFYEPTQIVLCPPLTTNTAQIDSVINVLDKILTCWENSKYKELIDCLAKKSNGYSDFFHADKLTKLSELLQKCRHVLILGSAAIPFIELIIRMCKYYNVEYKLYLNNQQKALLNDTFGINETDHIIQHPYTLYNIEIMKNDMCRIQEEYHFDHVILPYSRAVNTSKNIVEVAELIQKPIYLIQSNASVSIVNTEPT